MNSHYRKQRGAILAMMAVLIVALIGIAALALDLGRLFVERTQLQNAADAAALAAAAELDGESGARSRAMAAARQVFLSKLDRGIYFGSDFAEDDDITCFKFYSSIDPEKVPAQEPGDPPASDYCTDGTALSSGANDADARFVELIVDLTETEEGIPLFFLPVLDLIPGVDNVPTKAGTKARALAGVENVPCYEPAMFMCVDDKNNLPIEEGEGLRARIHGGNDSTWTAGNFGFLLPTSYQSPSAPNISEFLGDAGNLECLSGAQYKSGPGQNAQQSKRGLNTRFDVYEGGRLPGDFPPAPNIINYGYRDDTDPTTNYRDLGLGTEPGEESFRVGNGNWNRNAYFTQYHTDPVTGITTYPPDWNTISHWKTYLWELGLDADGEPAGSPNMPIAESDWGPPPVGSCDPALAGYPNTCHGYPNPDHFYCPVGDTDCSNYDAIYHDATNPSIPYPVASEDPLPQTAPEKPVTHLTRRVMYLAALQCDDFSMTGAWTEEDVDVLKEGRILEFFLTELAPDPGGGSDKFEIFMEYIGPTEEGGGLTRRVIQLYE